MTATEWGVFGGFVALLIGLSLFNAQLATIVGIGVVGIITLQYLDKKGFGT